jgi:hypothetical protein
MNYTISELALRELESVASATSSSEKVTLLGVVCSVKLTSINLTSGEYSTFNGGVYQFEPPAKPVEVPTFEPPAKFVEVPTSESPGFAPFVPIKEGMKRRRFSAYQGPKLGMKLPELFDWVKLILEEAERPLTSTEITDRLEALGVDFLGVKASRERRLTNMSARLSNFRKKSMVEAVGRVSGGMGVTYLYVLPTKEKE